MKKISFFLLVITLGVSCSDRGNAPDISSIQVSLQEKRFDRDFFSMDTNAMRAELGRLGTSYPQLLPLFLQNIVGVNTEEEVKAYYRSYKPVYDSAQKLYKDFKPVLQDIEKAFRYVKYYFPAYKAPAYIIPVLGPMNSREDLARMANGEYTPDFIGPDFVGVSLQFYLGKDFSLYNEEYFVNNVTPLYRSRRFSKEYITADVMKLIVDDLFPDNSNSWALIDQMIEKGKHWWLLDKLLPGKPDSVKTGYSTEQLEWCEANEGMIWTYFNRDENLLYAVDPPTIQTYIGEAPFTQGFSQEYSPGNIGPWVGWQIVKKFEQKHAGMKIEEIMKAPVKQILEESKYKPK